MANPGAKFVSVNLNKSYGQQQQHQSGYHFSHFNGGGGGAYGRGRPGSGGGGGGMVVLSRSRGGGGGVPKVVPKLSVPPPLNLPSLRKEHEKFDMSAPGGGTGGGAGSGTGSRPASSGVGWTKPAAVPNLVLEKNESGDNSHGVGGTDVADGVGRGTGSYMPPSARANGVGVVRPGSASRVSPSVADKSMVLRGEDFPSLQAARPTSSGASQKQKDGLSQKQRHAAGEESTQDKKDSYHLGPLADGQASRSSVGNGSVESGGDNRGMGNRRMADPTRKREVLFPDPLPLVRVNPRSDWADDERDTGHGFMERERDFGYSKSENYWDRDFDFPRPSVLPHKPAQNHSDRWGQRDNETGKNFFSEVHKMDPYPKDLRASSREGREVSKWRASPIPRDGSTSQEVRNDGIDDGARMFGHDKMVKENKYFPSQYGDSVRDGTATVNRDSSFGRRDLGVVGRQQPWLNSMESYNNRGAERNSRDRHGTEQQPSNRYRGDNFQGNTYYKSSVTSGGKLPPVTDHIPTASRDKRYSKSDRPYVEDPFLRDLGSASFDETDLFSGGLIGVIKRKKDAAKSTDFHDPVRESFEAELERVQKMQELERQRIIEEQERVLEQARREEEERQRKIREEEERQRRLEEEAREAAWRAEQERLEAIRRAEEQRIAREEEKKRIELEEERRKQAAKQKLLELEARMAKRQAEAVQDDVALSSTAAVENPEAAGNDRDILRNLEVDTWEDADRMVEKGTMSASFDSSVYGGPVEMSSRPYPPREGSSSLLDRGKGMNPWRRDVFDNGPNFPSLSPDQEIGHYSPRRDASSGGRTVPRKEFHGGPGYMSSRAYSKAGSQDPYPYDFGYQNDHRWSFPGDADPYAKLRDMDSEVHDGISERYGDYAWGQGRPRGGPRSPYPERLYPYVETNELYSYGRSRYSMRQPRVLPPPLSSAQRSNFREVSEQSGPSSFRDNEIQSTDASRSESNRQMTYYGGNECTQSSVIAGEKEEHTPTQEQKLNNASRCDSPSSLSVSSPPTSPPHLSHDELDVSGDSPVASAVAETKRSALNARVSVVLNDSSGIGARTAPSDSVSAVEDEEWTVENDDSLQQQEEYDEDEDGYREEDDVRDDENLDLNEKFDGLELEERESSHMMDNVVLGFDEGVEVVIPNDDSEKNLGAPDISFGDPETSLRVIEEIDSAGGDPSEGHSLPVDDSSGKSVDSYSHNIPGNESALQGPVGQPVAPYSSASDVVNGADISGSTGSQPAIVSSGEVSVASGSTNLQSASSVGSRAELPVKLQFGLFSGPSLIPSPVPAIQIGSIQMPLHIHAPVGPSLTHMHPSQPPMFQFGQLRYTSPISQGILPVAPPSMSFVQANMQGHYNLNQNAGGSVPHQPTRDAAPQDVSKDELPSSSTNRKPNFVPAPSEQSSGNFSRGLNAVPVADRLAGDSIGHSTSPHLPGVNNKKMKSESFPQAEEKGQQDAVSKSYLPYSKDRGSENQPQHVQPMVHSVSNDKNFSVQRGPGPFSSGRGKRFAYAVKNANTRSSFHGHDALTESNGFPRRPRRTVQRTEFRIRENNDRRQAPQLGSSNHTGIDDKSNHVGKSTGGFTRSGSKRGTMSNRTIRQRTESEPSVSANVVPQEVNSGGRSAKDMAKDLSDKSQNKALRGEASLRKSVSEEDVDAPLQSGVVRVFKQPGIEAPSDEDDFIEVRSKRQMLNDRREQREKEIKAKSRIAKPPRKPRPTRQNAVVPRSHKLPERLAAEESNHSQFDFTASESSQLPNKEVSTGFTPTGSQPLAPIGTPASSSEAQTTKSCQAESVSMVSDGGTDQESGVVFESKNKVMSLTQTQLDEAMQPARYDSHIATAGGPSGTATDPILPSPSVMTKDKAFSSATNPINSLLAGEKIQFGAVTSPTVLPPTTRVLSHGIGAPGSNRADVQVSRNFPAPENDSSLFFEKEKHANDSCVPLQDCEAEAEAAASAVAVAAISNDEIVGNSLGPGSVQETKSFDGAGVGADATTGVIGDQQLASQSRGEELSVSLPADLSVETTPISLWPPLPSPQGSSSQMLSHFPGGPHSHFPFYEMNPVLGGPIFAFSPHEESSGAQSLSQKSTAPTSGPLGNWQQCHSGVDSFYGPPAGYPGPFISPPGGIPAVQGPPHMVVYNHFAPVGQYGQVGLSFMGTTYIPSGKQADWKHTPSSSTMHAGEGEMSNINMAAVQRNAPNMTAPVQHLAPGSPLMPIASPLPMFDVSPFQPAPDLSVQARWGHITASQLHSVPVSRPLQPQVEAALPSQVNHGHATEQSLPVNRFSESRIPTPSDKGSSFTVAGDTNATSFPAELRLVDPLKSDAVSSGQSTVVQSSSSGANAESGKTENGIGNSGKHQHGSSAKTLLSQKNSTMHQGNSTNYNYHRSGMSQRNNSGHEWSHHRRMGFHGRNQSNVMDKGYPVSKMKQIYVAKQTTSTNPTS